MDGVALKGLERLPAALVRKDRTRSGSSGTRALPYISEP